MQSPGKPAITLLTGKTGDKSWSVERLCTQPDVGSVTEEWSSVGLLAPKPKAAVNWIQAGTTGWGSRRMELDIAPHELMERRLLAAARMLISSVEIDRRRRSGIPVLRSTRFPISQFLAELAADRSLSDIAADYQLDAALLRSLLEGLAICIDRPLA